MNIFASGTNLRRTGLAVLCFVCYRKIPNNPKSRAYVNSIHVLCCSLEFSFSSPHSAHTHRSFRSVRDGRAIEIQTHVCAPRAWVNGKTEIYTNFLPYTLELCACLLLAYKYGQMHIHRACTCSVVCMDMFPNGTKTVHFSFNTKYILCV